jgi:hypothetical protein
MSRHRRFLDALIGCRVDQIGVLSSRVCCRPTPLRGIQGQVGTAVQHGKAWPSVTCSSRCGGRRVPVEHASVVAKRPPPCRLLQSTARPFLERRRELTTGLDSHFGRSRLAIAGQQTAGKGRRKWRCNHSREAGHTDFVSCPPRA